MQKIDRTTSLLKRYLSGKIDEQEVLEVKRLFMVYPQLKKLIEQLDTEEGLHEALRDFEKESNSIDQEQEEQVLSQVLSRIQSSSPTKQRSSPLGKRLLRYAAAAALIAILSYVVVLWKSENSAVQVSKEMLATTFAPGGNKASLTLSNGQRITLSEAYSGIVVDDRIAYDDGSPLFGEVVLDKKVMLTLSTPRGGQYQVVLSDGTKVWLNAESTLHYPYVFSDNERRVELEGEAYFEVAHRKEAPFIVTTPKEEVKVLGTHFNINSYPKDEQSTVALLQGSVQVSASNSSKKILKPGEQSVQTAGRIEVKPINIDEAVAWKNGEFMFNNESLESVMRKVARWYDLDIRVAPELRDMQLWGSVSRFDNFNQVLKIIKMTDDNIRFEIEGRRVSVVK